MGLWVVFGVVWSEFFGFWRESAVFMAFNVCFRLCVIGCVDRERRGIAGGWGVLVIIYNGKDN